MPKRYMVSFWFAAWVRSALLLSGALYEGVGLIVSVFGVKIHLEAFLGPFSKCPCYIHVPGVGDEEKTYFSVVQLLKITNKSIKRKVLNTNIKYIKKLN